MAKKVQLWRDRLDEASHRFGRVEICAVTKTQPPEAIALLEGTEITVLGENRVQELLGKLPMISERFEMQLIGRLQTNKARQVVDAVSLVQSLDRDELALELDKRAKAKGKALPVLVQVNIAGEAQKAGVSEDELDGLIKRVSALEGLRIKGLMAIMPLVADPEQVRPYFRRMRQIFDRYRELGLDNVDMQILSMGMSDDSLVAASEGATMVRLGRALFGERQ